jgi:hypothetical protein
MPRTLFWSICNVSSTHPGGGGIDWRSGVQTINGRFIWVRVRVRVTLRLAAYRQSVRLGSEPLETHGQNSFSQLNTCGNSHYITSSLTSGWVCHLQLLLAVASTFSLGSMSRGTPEYILLSQIRDLPFCRLLRLSGLRWRYSTPPPHGKFIWMVENLYNITNIYALFSFHVYEGCSKLFAPHFFSEYIYSKWLKFGDNINECFFYAHYFST